MLRAERKGQTATCHRPERRMDSASSGIWCLRVALGAGFIAAIKAGMRSSRCFVFGWSLLAICGWIGLPASGYAQQQAGLQNATDELKPMSPKKGRDNNYTAQQMTDRLIALAEGPIPLRDALEREFGFDFTIAHKGGGEDVYHGWAGKPFAQQFHEGLIPANIQYIETNTGGAILALYFLIVHRSMPPPQSSLCVATFDILKPLLEGGWVRHRRSQSGQLDIRYSAQIGGVQRTLQLSPSEGQGSQCLNGFFISYRPSSNRDGDSK